MSHHSLLRHGSLPRVTPTLHEQGCLLCRSNSTFSNVNFFYDRFAPQAALDELVTPVDIPARGISPTCLSRRVQPTLVIQPLWMSTILNYCWLSLPEVWLLHILAVETLTSRVMSVNHVQSDIDARVCQGISEVPISSTRALHFFLFHHKPKRRWYIFGIFIFLLCVESSEVWEI